MAGVKAKAVIFPLSKAASPSATSFVNVSGVKFNTISANDFSFYDELNAVVQNEPADWVDADTVGLYASIGIRKGQLFAPDVRMNPDGGVTIWFEPKPPAGEEKNWVQTMPGKGYNAALRSARALVQPEVVTG